MRESHAIRPIESAVADRAERPVSFNHRGVLFGTMGLVMAAAIGTWLVWYGIHAEHEMVMNEIRGACTRVMPDAVERCIDTVVIQRGGARR